VAATPSEAAAAAPLARFLALRAELIARAPADPGLGLCHALSDQLDQALAALTPYARDDIALVAVGGYGRRELCLFSDIDLMLLCRDRVDRALADALFYPLWDAGLKVGHAVRTLADADVAAGERIETLTALLDARLVAGAQPLLDDLSARLLRRLTRGRAALRETLLAAEGARRAAEPFQVQEINLKDGRGGLRTLQRLRWLTLLDGTEPKLPAAVLTAQTVLLAARNATHAVAGRAQDVWLLESAAAACRWLGREPNEFSSTLYLALREIDRLAPSDASQPSPVARSRRGLAVLRSRRAAEPPQPSQAEPAPQIRSVFHYAATLAQSGETRLPTTAEAQIAAAHGATWSSADRDGLLALLRSGERGAAIIEELARAGWLERTLPEWRHTRGLPQQAAFHLHPLDTHMLRTVSEAVAAAEGRTPEPWCRAIADELGGLDELLLAALLHDIGKGWQGDHAETGAAAAAAIGRRARFAADITHTVATAVRQHLLLPLVATRRDVTDERVVALVADQAGRARTLRVLCLLSVADSRASGPAVWGAWKASLVFDLYLRALRVLEARESATLLATPAPDAIDDLAVAAAGRYERAAIARQIEAMPPGYTRAFASTDLLRHLDLMHDLAPGALRYDVQRRGDAYDLALALADRPGLVAVVAGVLALHSLSVLEARFFTRADGMALQAYQVVDALAGADAPDRWPRVARDLERALTGELPLEERLEEKMHAYRRAERRGGLDVRVDQASDNEFTVLEVHATDRVGLLYTIARTLYAQRLDIHFAKIDTQGRQVVDVFYLRDVAGSPLRDGERVRELRAALLDILAR
jgi:[protein-PII] uridylyltransferase